MCWNGCNKTFDYVDSLIFPYRGLSIICEKSEAKTFAPSYSNGAILTVESFFSHCLNEFIEFSASRSGQKTEWMLSC